MGKRFQGDVWFNKKVGGRTQEALVHRSKVFEQEHSEDSDEELIEYVRKCAQSIGHTPYKHEVVGAKFISDRFGGWGKVIVAAKLPPTPPDPPTLERCTIYKDEFRRQAKLFKAERNKSKMKNTVKSTEESNGEC